MGLFGDFFGEVKKGVNSTVGGSYRDIYFKRYPDRYHACKGCGDTLDREMPRQVEIDHIVPKKCGGTNAITNLQVLCKQCNLRKLATINELTLEYSGAALARELKTTLGY